MKFNLPSKDCFAKWIKHLSFDELKKTGSRFTFTLQVAPIIHADVENHILELKDLVNHELGKRMDLSLTGNKR